MDKIEKALAKLTAKERLIIKNILTQLMAGSFGSLDIKKLKDNKNIFRVRKGQIRIIFIKNNEQINILAIERRSDKTYNF